VAEPALALPALLEPLPPFVLPATPLVPAAPAFVSASELQPTTDAKEASARGAIWRRRRRMSMAVT
jgi:hypothetical protein